MLNIAILNEAFYGNENMDEKFGEAQSRRGKIVFRVLNGCEQYEYVRVHGRVTLNWSLKQ